MSRKELKGVVVATLALSTALVSVLTLYSIAAMLAMP